MSEQRTSLLEVIVEESITGVMAFDPATGESVYVNRFAREALELDIAYRDGEKVSVRLEDLVSEDVRGGLMPFTSYIYENEGYYQNVVMRKRDGRAIIANVSIKQVEAEGTEARKLVMFEDITLQKKLLREIEVKQEQINSSFHEILEQNRQLKELDQAKNRFIALTTHELRTPLSAIVATSEVLDMKLYENEAQRDEFIKTVHEQGLQLMELVNDILDFAKIQAGKMELYVEHFDPRDLLKKIVGGFDHMAVQADVTIDFQYPGEEILAYGDVLRLKEVVNNVVSNAIKYNKKGGSVTITVNHHAVDGKKYLRIAVADTGQGIPEDKIKHVFNEFETVGNVSRHHKGTGLGMPISKRLMDAVGGGLSLVSIQGVGTTFFIDLPFEKVLSEEFYRKREDNWQDDLAA